MPKDTMAESESASLVFADNRKRPPMHCPVADNPYSSLVPEIEGGKSDAYLVSKGVPSTIIEEGRKYGPNEAYFVDAQTLRRSGFDVEITQ